MHIYWQVVEGVLAWWLLFSPEIEGDVIFWEQYNRNSWSDHDRDLGGREEIHRPEESWEGGERPASETLSTKKWFLKPFNTKLFFNVPTLSLKFRGNCCSLLSFLSTQKQSLCPVSWTMTKSMWRQAIAHCFLSSSGVCHLQQPLLSVTLQTTYPSAPLFFSSEEFSRAHGESRQQNWNTETSGLGGPLAWKQETDLSFLLFQHLA